MNKKLLSHPDLEQITDAYLKWLEVQTDCKDIPRSLWKRFVLDVVHCRYEISSFIAISNPGFKWNIWHKDGLYYTEGIKVGRTLDEMFRDDTQQIAVIVRAHDDVVVKLGSKVWYEDKDGTDKGLTVRKLYIKAGVMMFGDWRKNGYLLSQIKECISK